jgi:DNA-binding transcriptional LysR family regulator
MNDLYNWKLDLNLLRTLHVLLEEQQVSRAATRLNLTQPAVSHALQRLRQHFGDPLFVRQGQRMIPTPRTRELEGPLRQVLQSIDRLAGPATFNPAAAQGKLRIATTDYGLAVVLPNVLARLAEEAPNLAISSTMITGDSFDHLKTGFLDLALSGQESFGDVEIETLFRERFVIVTHRSHPLVGKPIGVEDFVAYPHAIIDVVQSRLHAIDRRLKRLGLKRRIALSLPHMLAAPFFAHATNLLMPVPERVAHLYAEQLDLVIHEPPPEVDIGRFDYVQAWHERRTNDPMHRWLRDLVRQSAGTISDSL